MNTNSSFHLKRIFAVVWILLATVGSVVGCDDSTRPDGSKQPRLIDAAPSYGTPLWAPDGSRLYFNHRPLVRIYEDPAGSGLFYYEFNDSLAGFYTVEISGQAKRRIHPVGLSSPDISANGSWIYYELMGQVWRISVLGDSIDASSAGQVTAHDGAGAPSVSPSGTRLLYDIVTGPDAGVHITGAAGGSHRRIGTPGWRSPDWGPSDSGFTFLGDGSVIAGIGVVDTFGVGATQINGSGSHPRWSPDGQHIAFINRIWSGPNPVDQLWIMNRDGSSPRMLTSESVMPGFCWNAEGTEIAYVRFGVDFTYINGTIWIVNVSTLAKRQVTTNP